MKELPLFDKEGNPAGTVSIDETIFGEKVNKALLHNVIIMYEANKRQGTASTKTRGEVEGSTRKPWRQKHTGRARAGTIRSPIWRKGGIVFGPKPRDYRKVIPKKMRRKALDSALLGKILDNEVKIIESFEFDKPSTKRMAGILKKIGIERKCLVGIKDCNTNVWLSARNLPNVQMMRVSDFNAYDVLRHREILLTKEGLDFLIDSRKARAPEEVPQIAST